MHILIHRSNHPASRGNPETGGVVHAARSVSSHDPPTAYLVYLFEYRLKIQLTSPNPRVSTLLYIFTTIVYCIRVPGFYTNYNISADKLPKPFTYSFPSGLTVTIVRVIGFLAFTFLLKGKGDEAEQAASQLQPGA